jgi:hypothetical protein
MNNRSVLIIEHRYSPDRADLEAGNGRFNVGLVSFRNNAEGKKVLSWWRERCLEWCYFRVEDGKMGDQMYLNCWPDQFEGVHILKHLGGGLAPWNIKNYKISKVGSVAFVNSDRLIFYHFHAFRIFKTLDFEPAANYIFNWVELRLIYRPYITALKNAVSLVKSIDPNFNFGFSDRPNPWISRYTVKNRIREWLAFSI